MAPARTDTWNKPIKQVANPDEYARIIVTYCKKAQAATGSAPAIVGIENEVDQPPEVFKPWRSTLRRELDKAGFTATKIHMADASYMFLGIDRARAPAQESCSVECHRLLCRARVRLPGVHRQPRPLRRAHEGHARGRRWQALPRHGDLHQRSALPGAFVPHRLRRGPALPQEPHRAGRHGAHVLLDCCSMWSSPPSPVRARCSRPIAPAAGFPCPPAISCACIGAYSRHILKGMQRIGVEIRRSRSACDRIRRRQNETLVVVNRSATARNLTVQGATLPWAEMERTGLEEENAVSAVPSEVVIQPGEIVVFSTIKAEYARRTNNGARQPILRCGMHEPQSSCCHPERVLREAWDESKDLHFSRS